MYELSGIKVFIKIEARCEILFNGIRSLSTVSFSLREYKLNKHNSKKSTTGRNKFRSWCH